MNAAPIPGYEGYYATPDGRVISGRTEPPKELVQRVHKGYLHVVVRAGTGRAAKRKLPVHQLVLSAFAGERPFSRRVAQARSSRR